MWLLFILPHFSFSQQPSFEVVGEEELGDVEIYKLIEDHKGNLIIASNNGIYRYDGYSFKPLKLCSQAISRSFFNLKSGPNRGVYCNNLRGQIFKVEKDSVVLIHSVPNQFSSEDLDFEILDDQTILVAHQKLYTSKNNQITVLSDTANRLVRNPLGQIFTVNSGYLMEYKNAQLDTIVQMPGSQTFFAPAEASSEFLTLKERNFNRVLTYNFSKSELKEIEFPNRTMHHLIIDSELWMTSEANGVINMPVKDLGGIAYHEYFQNFFVSCLYQMKSGIFVLGTFNNGLLLIRDRKLNEVSELNVKHKITQCVAVKDKVILGTQDGTVYAIDQEFNIEKIGQLGKRIISLSSIDDILFIATTNSLGYTYRFTTKTLAKNDGKYYVHTLKDVVEISKNERCFATNVGAFYTKDGVVRYKRILGDKKIRTVSCTYDPQDKSIYTCTVEGLMKADANHKVEEIDFKGKPIIGNDCCYYDGRIYVATPNLGVLIFENDLFKGQISVNTGLSSDKVNQIEVQNGKLYISTSNLFHVFDLLSNELYSYGESNGMFYSTVNEFALTDDRLWIVNKSAIQSILLKDLTPISRVPDLIISSIIVNDSIRSLKQNEEFDYDENRMTFELHCLAIGKNDELVYEIKLEGLDQTWKRQSYHQNKIEFKSLPSGEYVLRVRPVFQGNIGKEVRYSFQIKVPFWETWWFYVLIIVLSLFISFVVYRRYAIGKIRKAEQESQMNELKITAIQSQMNPHFIFNSINSIQDLILKEDIDNSYVYTTKFSQLVRKTLDFSREEWIDLSDEIELLTLYLSLEELRFKTNFTYQFNVDEDDEGFQVPPMLIQPFIENALLHGLLHKAGEKELTINLSVGEYLICEVIDNGIGRERSREINERQKKRGHKSFATSAINERFDILKNNYQEEVGFEYHDLTNSEGDSIGTKVRVTIPIRQIF